MAMSPRLLRPRATVHPEAAAWAARVVANGGSVSGSTLSAVSKFCASIASAGIRDRFYRMGIFAGSNLNAALVPLFRGPSLGGTQYGGTTDTNVGGLFVSGDYAETGATGGLTGNGSSKYLNTGLAQNAVPAGDRHLSAYECAKDANAYRVTIGSRSSDLTNGFYMTKAGTTTSYGYQGQASVGTFPCVDTSYTQSGAHWIGNQPLSTSVALYKNGSNAASATVVAPTPTARNVYVFALNETSTVGDFSTARLGAYSVGLSFTSTQALAYYNAMQAFQTALTRNV